MTITVESKQPETEAELIWECPICKQVLKRRFSYDSWGQNLNARYFLHGDAINHLATHIIDCSAPTIQKEDE